MTRPWAGLIASMGGFLYRRIGRPPIRRCTDVIVVHDFRGERRCPDCGHPGIAQIDSPGSGE